MTSRGVLLDTHIAIWLIEGALDAAALDALEASADDGGLLVSTASAWEIGLLAQARGGGAGRLTFRPDPLSWFQRLLDRPGIVLAPLTPDIAIASSLLPAPIHKDPADRMLVATARICGVPIATRDRLILDYAEQGHVAAIPC